VRACFGQLRYLVLTKPASPNTNFDAPVPDATVSHLMARCDSVATYFTILTLAAGGRIIDVQSGKVSSGGSAASLRVQSALGSLRDRHERVTRARQAVIEVLDGTDEHLAAEEIVARAEASAPGVHRATVYRALSTLGELGLVTHTHVGGSATVYHLALPARTNEAASVPHAHLQCTNCQAVIDIPADVLDSLISRVNREVGFQVEPHHAALLGLCADCREATAETSQGQQS
jgi:Fur family ferric uptake transcriptional regulator